MIIQCNNLNCQLLCRCVWSSIGKEMCSFCGWCEYADEGDLRCPASHRATATVAGPSNLVRSQRGCSHEAHWHSGRYILGFDIYILFWTTRELVRRTCTVNQNCILKLELVFWKKAYGLIRNWENMLVLNLWRMPF